MKLTAEATVLNDQKLGDDIDGLNDDIDRLDDDISDVARIAGDTAQYFWVTTTGTDTGAHITEISREDFLDDPSGGNLLARSNGIAVRNGLTELATFGSSSSRIGQTNGKNVVLSTDGLDFRQKSLSMIRMGTGTSGSNSFGSLLIGGQNGSTQVNCGAISGDTSARLGIHSNGALNIDASGATSIVGTSITLTGNMGNIAINSSGTTAFTLNGHTKVNGQFAVSDGLYKITEFPVNTGAVNANDNVSAADRTMTAYGQGYTAVGIVGWASSNWRIRPTSNYIKNNTTLYAGFANDTGTNVSSATVTFRVLWIKTSIV